MNGMAPQHSPLQARGVNNQRHVGSSYPAYHSSQTYQIPPFLPQTGYLPNNYPSASYVPTNGIYQQAQPYRNVATPTTPRASGIAVVIPASSPRTQRNGSSPTIASKPTAPASWAPQSPSLDHQLLLLSLAEDYFSAARSQAWPRESNHEKNTMRQYYKLIATGLACLETLLKRFKLQPQMEANVRLRYASILYEETENILEAEQCLSEGMKLCDRYRIFDLKHNMEHLLAQVLFKASPRASLKFLDGVIKDAEAYQHTAWVYALRFLKVSLLLQLSSHQDTLSAFSQLKSISTLAEHFGDKAILAIASTLEALVHLRESSSTESIEQAQRAIALARSLQHDDAVGQISQLAILTNIVDLSCSLLQFDPSQAVAKMQAMQTSLEGPHDSWHDDGSFLIPAPSQGASRAPNGNGIVRKDSRGELSVMFSWAPWTDVYALGYLLSSISISHRNNSECPRSEQMLKEGMRVLESRIDVPVWIVSN